MLPSSRCVCGEVARACSWWAWDALWLRGVTLAARVFLFFSAVVWLPYGLFCFFQPSFLVEAAGVGASSLTGTIELRAMYGGLETGIGLLVLSAACRPALLRSALVVLAFLCSGLALARLGGIILDGDLSAYTICALAFETVSAGLAWGFLRRTPDDAAA